MGKSYRPYHPDQEFLLPPSLREWLPENHLVYFVSDVVDNLNLSALDAVYGDEQRGQPPYDPRMMTKVLVYGYCVGVFSSRRIERRLAEDVGFRVLAAGNAPNFRTIADFRKLHLDTLAGLFEEVLKIALEAGALKLGRVALDGTKLKANANSRRASTYSRLVERDQELEALSKRLLDEAARGEDADAVLLPQRVALELGRRPAIDAYVLEAGHRSCGRDLRPAARRFYGRPLCRCHAGPRQASVHVRAVR